MQPSMRMRSSAVDLQTRDVIANGYLAIEEPMVAGAQKAVGKKKERNGDYTPVLWAEQ